MKTVSRCLLKLPLYRVNGLWMFRGSPMRGPLLKKEGEIDYQHTLTNICKARIQLMGLTYNNNIGATWLGGDTLERANMI